jgi:type VI secretion system protein ImpC
MSESIQMKLGRVRPPRVQITYDVETGGAIEKKELPFIVGIFADLAGQSPVPPKPVSERKLVDIDRDNFDAVMEKVGPAVLLSGAKNVLPPTEQGDDSKGPTLAGVLGFAKLDDFEPLNVVSRIPALAAIYAKRSRLRDMQSKLETSPKLYGFMDGLFAATPDDNGTKLKTELAATFAAGSKPDDWKKAALGPTCSSLLLPLMVSDDDTDERKQYALQLLGQFQLDIMLWQPPADDATAADEIARKGLFARFDHRVAQLDGIVGTQLNEVMHADAFKRLEATWRGLGYLVSRSETGTMLKLRVMHITKDELYKDLDKAVEFDQSTIFKMIYEAEYGTYGGQPYSLLMGDYEFGRTPTDFDLLGKISQVAAAAHAPFLASAYCKLFDLATFEDLANPRDLSKIFESLELDGWREFRKSEDSRYVTLTLPRVLLRLPYGGDRGMPVDGLDYEEMVSGTDQKTFLWGNPAYILAERITNAFSLYGWTAAIRGVEGGGLVEGLPAYTFSTTEGDIRMVCPTQVAITDRREKELNDLGFMAICNCKNTGQAAFFGGQTTNKPKKYLSDEANANAQISAMLPYVLCASRFAHYIKVIMRDKIGKFMTRGNVESYLNNWMSQYILLDDDAVQEVKAVYPLRAGKVVVTDTPGKPGSYRATVFLKPHFQLEELTTSIRLVADIPAK